MTNPDKTNTLFLDFDGVVNTPMWSRDEKGKWGCDYNMPSDGCVNNTQAVQWVSEFCQKYDYHEIVITSTWRRFVDDLQKLLDNSGLRKGIRVVGQTPVLFGQDRGDEISLYLADNPQITNYLIFDDEGDMGEHINRLVLCGRSSGFDQDSYNHAISLHNAFNKELE